MPSVCLKAVNQKGSSPIQTHDVFFKSTKPKTRSRPSTNPKPSLHFKEDPGTTFQNNLWDPIHPQKTLPPPPHKLVSPTNSLPAPPPLRPSAPPPRSKVGPSGTPRRRLWRGPTSAPRPPPRRSAASAWSCLQIPRGAKNRVHRDKRPGHGGKTGPENGSSALVRWLGWFRLGKRWGRGWVWGLDSRLRLGLV